MMKPSENMIEAAMKAYAAEFRPADWKYTMRAALTAALAEMPGEPVAWVIPGEDNARADGFLDAMAWEEGEFTRPLHAAPPAPAVVVKALSWQQNRNDCEIWRAYSIAGYYTVMKILNIWESTRSTTTDLGEFFTVEEAKAAAQADFDLRIRSALEDSK